MKFNTRTTTGHGRGKTLGFPTVNMDIPENIPLQMQQGVYAARAEVGGQKYAGMLYYGPATVFGETNASLEIYLFDTLAFYVGPQEPISIEIVKYVRPVMNFDLPELLIRQMEKDEHSVRTILKI